MHNWRIIDASIFLSREKKDIKFGLLDKEIVNKENHDFSRRSPYTLLSSLLFLYRAPFGRISVLTRLARSGIINRSLSLFFSSSRAFSLFASRCSARSFTTRLFRTVPRKERPFLSRSLLCLSFPRPQLFSRSSTLAHSLPVLSTLSDAQFPGFELGLSFLIVPRSLPTCPSLPPTLPLTRSFPRAFPICLSFPLASPFSLLPYPILHRRFVFRARFYELP